MEEGTYLQNFTPVRAHLPLREVYVDSPHHNDGTHLIGGVPDDSVWKMFWFWLAAQSASYYSTPLSKVGCRFTAVLDVECQGVLDWKCNFKQPLVFTHLVLTRTLGACKAREIRVMIDRWIEIWEWGIHTGLVGNLLAERRDRKDRVEKINEEEVGRLACSLHSPLMPGKIRQVICRVTDREKG